MDNSVAAQGTQIGLGEGGDLSPSEYRVSGYCAGCGTWDAHGLTCLSCGYAFTPDANSETVAD